MWVGLVTIFPEMFTAVTGYGVTGRAIERELLNVAFFNPRDFTTDKHRTVDDRPYGGGPGMLMKVEPLTQAIDKARESAFQTSGSKDCKVLYMSPQGRQLDHQMALELQQHETIVIVSGRYEGIDERVIESQIDEEVSIGDYVLSGGELPAMVLIDAMARLTPGVLGHEDSALTDSFGNGLLDFPQYTRPERVHGNPVPDVLLSGDHAMIAKWREKQSLGRTWLRRPGLLAKIELSEKQQQLLEEFKREYSQSSQSGGKG